MLHSKLPQQNVNVCAPKTVDVPRTMYNVWDPKGKPPMFEIRHFRNHLSFNSILMNLTADLKPVQSPVNTRPMMIYSHDAVTRAAGGNMIASSDSTEHTEQSIVTLLLLLLIVYGFFLWHCICCRGYLLLRQEWPWISRRSSDRMTLAVNTQKILGARTRMENYVRNFIGFSCSFEFFRYMI